MRYGVDLRADLWRSFRALAAGGTVYLDAVTELPLEAQGKSIIHLEIGEPDFQTAQPICDAGIRAIEAGKHVYTEKPIASTLEDLERAPGISRAMARQIYDYFHPRG